MDTFAKHCIQNKQFHLKVGMLEVTSIGPKSKYRGVEVELLGVNTGERGLIVLWGKYRGKRFIYWGIVCEMHFYHKSI